MLAFSEKLVSIREVLRLTQGELADLVGVSRNYIGMLENGREPSSQLRYQIEQLVNGTPCFAMLKERRRAKMSYADLAKKTGYDASVLQAVETGQGKASERMIEKIVEALPRLNKEELMSGSDQARVIGETQATYGTKPEIDLPPGMSARFVPILSMAQAGAMAEWTDEAYEYEGQIAFDVKDKKAFAVKIRGDSMEPRYREGDVAIVYPNSAPRNGSLVIARLTDGDVMFKLFHRQDDRVSLTSYNPLHPRLEMKADQITWAYPVKSVVTQVMED